MEESGRTENVSAENLGAENSGDRKIRPRIKVQLTGSEPFFGPGVRTLLEWIRRDLPQTKLMVIEPFLIPTDPQKDCWHEDLDPKIQAARKQEAELPENLSF